jgi:hypothetical protein
MLQTSQLFPTVGSQTEGIKQNAAFKQRVISRHVNPGQITANDRFHCCLFRGRR